VDECEADPASCCHPGASIITLTDADNTEYVNTGNACVLAKAGRDTVMLVGNPSPVTIVGGYGDDVVMAGEGSVKAYLGAGNDTINAYGGSDIVEGGDGDDIIAAGNGTNTVDGGDGNDNISTGTGNDTVYPGKGANTVATGDGDDTIQYFAECELEGAAGTTLTPGGGNDTLIAPISREAMIAKGIDVSGFETVTVAPDPCRSKCAEHPEPTASYTLDVATRTVTAEGEIACTASDAVALEIQKDDGTWVELGQAPPPFPERIEDDGTRLLTWKATGEIPYGGEYWTSRAQGRMGVIVRFRTMGGDVGPSEEQDTTCDASYECCLDTDDVWTLTSARRLDDKPFNDRSTLANSVQGVAHDDNHWYFSKAKAEGVVDRGGVWAVPVTSNLENLGGDNTVTPLIINPWLDLNWDHPGGMDYHNGRLFVALTDTHSRRGVGVIETAAVKGFPGEVDTDTAMPCPGKTLPYCYTNVIKGSQAPFRAYAHHSPTDSGNGHSTFAWLAVEPRTVPCTQDDEVEGEETCEWIYTIPYMNHEDMNDKVWIDVYEWQLEKQLKFVTRYKVVNPAHRLSTGGHRHMTNHEFGLGNYQGGKVSPNGQLYVTSHGTDGATDLTRTENALLVVQLPEPPDEMPDTTYAKATDVPDADAREAMYLRKFRVDSVVGKEISGSYEEFEDVALWDLDAERDKGVAVPDGLEGQIHVQLIDVNSPGDDDFFFKHLRLEETCEDGQHTWEARHDDHAWPTLMGAAANRACFLTDVTGAFEGSGEYVYIRERDTPEGEQWVIDGQSHQAQKIKAKARCVEAQNVSQEYSWVTSGPDNIPSEVVIGPAAGKACFITGMQGNFAGAGEHIHVVSKFVDGYSEKQWVFGGSDGKVEDDNHTGGHVRCIDATGVTEEFTRSWGDSSRIRLEPSADKVCAITQIWGALDGTGERVWITEEPNADGVPYWYLNTNSHPNAGGMAASAICFDRN
jgi:hypothetical protein